MVKPIAIGNKWHLVFLPYPKRGPHPSFLTLHPPPVRFSLNFQYCVIPLSFLVPLNTSDSGPHPRLTKL